MKNTYLLSFITYSNFCQEVITVLITSNHWLAKINFFSEVEQWVELHYPCNSYFSQELYFFCLFFPLMIKTGSVPPFWMWTFPLSEKNVYTSVISCVSISSNDFIPVTDQGVGNSKWFLPQGDYVPGGLTCQNYNVLETWWHSKIQSH